ncbi:T6SS effector BTH_I2691 family protein [Cupriavidus cauae]|uniref:Toxin VasX N-terminal region domain-containing protein n=1 Tax=Cupriavidus cauae TaxID=2608999 RepID=A0A5M8ANV6_9BURK|nr:T6SS effector BTH_I2691 family protein [Cupriavidus cauae]KAA6125193.1 hypothetical protein F1599_10345 [Cupriavidus cauae]
MTNNPAIESKCPFCDKQGLPILPVRYAIGRADKAIDQKNRAPGVPALASGFGGDVLSIPLPEDSAMYTLRMLREGFLYVFNEKRGTWSAYVVTEDGYLYEFDFNDPFPVLPADIKFSCTRKGDNIIARCITVADAQSAGRIWLGFSEVLWTDSIKSLHKSQAWREKHMRCIDLQAWRAGSGQAHTAQLSEVDKLVAEYSAPRTLSHIPAKMKGDASKSIGAKDNHSFSFSPFAFYGLQEEASGLALWGEATAKPYRPIVTALLDPQSLLVELDHLMQASYDTFIARNQEWKRKIAVSSAIMSLRDAIGNAAEDSARSRAAQDALSVSVFGTPNPGIAGDSGGAAALGKLIAEKLGGDKVSAHYKSLEEAYAKPPESELEKIRKQAWEKYQKRHGGEWRYDEAARESFQKEFESQLQRFDAQVLTPLAEAHRDWMSSDRTVNAFVANYDHADQRCGEVFVSSLTLCVGNTQDKKPCFELYREWLKGNVDERRNLLLRGLVLNQLEVLQRAKETKGKGIDLWNVSWPSLIKAYDFSAHRADVISHLILSLSGPIVSVLNNVAAPSARALAVILGLVSRRAIVPVAVTGDTRAFRRHLIKAIRDSATSAGQSVPSRKSMFDPVDLELNRLEARGVNMKGKATKEFFVAVDPNHIASMPEGLTKAQRAQWLAKSLKLSDELRLLDLPGGLRKVVRTDVKVGAVGAALDAVLLWNLWSDAGESMAHKKNDTWARVGAGLIGVVGGAGEAVSKVLSSRVEFGRQFGRALPNRLGTFLGKYGARVSLFGGVAIAILDVAQIYPEFKERNYAVSALYLLSAVAGGVLAAAAFSAATGVGIVAAVVLLAISALLVWFGDNDIQDWLERCYWGDLVEERYATHEIEMKQLRLAIKE